MILSGGSLQDLLIIVFVFTILPSILAFLLFRYILFRSYFNKLNTSFAKIYMGFVTFFISVIIVGLVIYIFNY